MSGRADIDPASPRGVDHTNTMKVIAYNVNGISQTVDAVRHLLTVVKPDVLVLNELKLSRKSLESVKPRVMRDAAYTAYWNPMETRGHHGVAVFVKQPHGSRLLCDALAVTDRAPLVAAALLPPSGDCSPAHVREKHQREGRLLAVEVRAEGHEPMAVVATYVPNSGRGLHNLAYRVRRWDPDLGAYLKALQSTHPRVLWIGDLNVAPEDVDIYDTTKVNCAGFTPAERESFRRMLDDANMYDPFREKDLTAVAYTYYSTNYDAKAYNHGWKLDHSIVSLALLEDVEDSGVMDDADEVLPSAKTRVSDHLPIWITFRANKTPGDAAAPASSSLSSSSSSLSSSPSSPPPPPPPSTTLSESQPLLDPKYAASPFKHVYLKHVQHALQLYGAALKPGHDATAELPPHDAQLLRLFLEDARVTPIMSAYWRDTVLRFRLQTRAPSREE